VSGLSNVVRIEERRTGLPREVARAILAGFDKHYSLFRAAAVEAKALFERSAWPQMRKLARERIGGACRRAGNVLKNWREVLWHSMADPASANCRRRAN